MNHLKKVDKIIRIQVVKGQRVESREWRVESG
jgi:hypothetical protein